MMTEDEKLKYNINRAYASRGRIYQLRVSISNYYNKIMIYHSPLHILFLYDK